MFYFCTERNEFQFHNFEALYFFRYTNNGNAVGIPNDKYISAIFRPPRKSQMIFATVCSLKCIVTFFSKGRKDSFSNLKHCTSNGTPNIVIQNKTPTILQRIASHKPPKRTHNIFLITFSTFHWLFLLAPI